MLSLFKRKAAAVATEPTFKARVDRFWEWYASVGERFYHMIEEKRAPELPDEVSAKVNEVIDGFAWVFGPGEDGGHSLTLSGEGNPHRQLLAAYWASRAPKLKGWTFYGSRQPSHSVGDICLKVGADTFEARAVWLTPAINEETKHIDITAWHPLFPKLDERSRWTILFLLLDEALGEIGTLNWIGHIDINDQKLSGAIPLGELRAFTERVQAERQWRKGGPGEIWTLYRPNEDNSDQLRGDLFVGSTSVMPLISEFMEARGQLKDPLAGTGADYVYIAFNAGVLPKGEEADARGEIEDALSAVLEPAGSGRHIGGAMGRRYVYIDLLLFDGANSIALVLESLRRQRLPAGTSINYFAHEKRGHRVML
ncbi:MAG TPA: hypothetical protein VK961_20270 [Chthoniobacter sp.]|nr:hypothetical protein [Chthoniobacter sp.]